MQNSQIATKKRSSGTVVHPPQLISWFENELQRIISESNRNEIFASDFHNLLEDLVYQQNRAKDAANLLSLIQEYKLPMDKKTVQIKIDCLQKLGNMDELLTNLEELKRLEELELKQQQQLPTIESPPQHQQYETILNKRLLTTYQTIIRNFILSYQISQAIRVFEHLYEQNIPADLLTSNLLLEATSKNDPSQIKRVFGLVLKHKVTPDYQSYKIVIHGLIKNQSPSEIASVLVWMKNHGMNLEQHLEAEIMSFMDEEQKKNYQGRKGHKKDKRYKS
jgi:hypothetical protein